MRVIAEALLLYLAAHDVLPDSRGDLIPVMELEERLVPEFLAYVFEEDPWCEDYLYWSDGSHNFLLVSGGRDRVIDVNVENILVNPKQRIEDWCRSISVEREADLLWLTGQFCPYSNIHD
jgi:hypothetical protein